MSLQPAALFEFDFFAPSPIWIEASDAPLTSDAGLLPHAVPGVIWSGIGLGWPHRGPW